MCIKFCSFNWWKHMLALTICSKNLYNRNGNRNNGIYFAVYKKWDFWHWNYPGGPVARTPHPQCQGPGFDPWSGNYDPANLPVQPKKKKLTLSHLVNYNSFFSQLMSSYYSPCSVFDIWHMLSHLFLIRHLKNFRLGTFLSRAYVYQ